MEICNNEHDEIVFEKGSRYSPCPLCEANSKIIELEKEVINLTEEMANHECK